MEHFSADMKTIALLLAVLEATSLAAYETKSDEIRRNAGQRPEWSHFSKLSIYDILVHVTGHFLSWGLPMEEAGS